MYVVIHFHLTVYIHHGSWRNNPQEGVFEIVFPAHVALEAQIIVITLAALPANAANVGGFALIAVNTMVLNT